MIELAERLTEIRKRRAVDVAWSVFLSIGLSELFFAAFAFGASFGPGPLTHLELILGLAGAFALGAAASYLVARRSVERHARFITRVEEGRRQPRIVVFDDYLTIDREIVPKMAIVDSALEPRGLVIRYRDPLYEGAVLRELSADRITLERLRAALISPLAPGARWPG